MLLRDDCLTRSIFLVVMVVHVVLYAARYNVYNTHRSILAALMMLQQFSWQDV
jgi:hypothetical protein